MENFGAKIRHFFPNKRAHLGKKRYGTIDDDDDGIVAIDDDNPAVVDDIHDEENEDFFFPEERAILFFFSGSCFPKTYESLFRVFNDRRCCASDADEQ